MPPSVPVTHSPHPPPSSPSTTPSSFLRVRSLHVLSPFLIFPTHFFSLPFYSLSLLFILPTWMRPYNVVLLQLTYFTQHNTVQFQPRRSKWWVFVVSNGCVILKLVLMVLSNLLQICAEQQKNLSHPKGRFPIEVKRGETLPYCFSICIIKWVSFVQSLPSAVCFACLCFL